MRVLTLRANFVNKIIFYIILHIMFKVGLSLRFQVAR